MQNYSKETKNRLKRAEGQIRGILRIMEENQSCRDVTVQLSAVRSALDRTIASIVAAHLHDCVAEAVKEGNETSQAVEEAIVLLTKSR